MVILRIDICKNMLFKLIIFFILTFLPLSCNILKQSDNLNSVPYSLSLFKDNEKALYQLVQTYGTNKSIIERESQLKAMSLIISRVESKVKSISEFRQKNSQTDFINITRLLSEFKVLKIELVESQTFYDKKSNKITFWAVYMIDRNQIKSLLDKDVSLDLTFEDLIE